MAGHAKFSPSSAKQWIACAASWKHNELAEQAPSSEAAREGTVAHALAELSLRQNVDPKTLVGKPLTVDLDGVAETVRVDKDMTDHVAVYYEHCRMLAMLSTRRMIEEQVHVPLSIHGQTTTEELWGTADFIAIADGERIDVVDLKYGMLPVEPQNNPQGIAYLLGALELCTASPVRKAAIHIVQPRLSKEPKIWEIDDVEALRKEWTHTFEQAVMRAKEAAILSAPLESQYCAGHHCRFCAHLPKCDAFAAHMIELTAEELAEIESPDYVATSEELDKLAGRFANKSIVNRYYRELEKYLVKAVRSGQTVSGYKLVQALGNRSWNADEKTIENRLRQQKLKKADIFAQNIKTPAQIEKVLEKPDLIEKWTTRKVSGEKLVPLSDKREPINIKGEVETIEIEGLDDKPVKLEQSPTMDLIDLGDDEIKENTEKEETKETEEIEDLIIF